MDGVAEARVPKLNPPYERPPLGYCGVPRRGVEPGGRVGEGGATRRVRAGRRVGQFDGKPALLPVAATPDLPNAQVHRHHSGYPKATPELPSVLEDRPERQSAVEVSVWGGCSERVAGITLWVVTFPCRRQCSSNAKTYCSGTICMRSWKQRPFCSYSFFHLVCTRSRITTDNPGQSSDPNSWKACMTLSWLRNLFG